MKSEEKMSIAKAIRKPAERASALISALALVAISSLLMSGICVLASSYATRQKEEADYAKALQLAEAGVNYELQYISTHLTTSPYAHQYSAPYTGSISGVTGSFTVWASKTTEGDNTTDSHTAWAPPADVKIVSTGTVSGIRRKVTVVCKTSGGGASTTPVFDGTFAVFGTQSLLFTQASNVVNGNMGANGPAPSGVSYSINTQSNGVVNVNSGSAKPLVLAGGASLISGNSVNPNYTNNPGKIDVVANNILWPTVDTIVAASFPNGWNTLSSSTSIAAQWSRMRTFKTQSRSLTSSGTKAITTYTTGQTTLTDSVMKLKADDNQWVNALILPPGDYYFSDVTLNRNNGYSGPSPVLYFDTQAVTTGGTPGPVRLWIGGSSTSADSINVDIQYTSTLDSDKAKNSRMFYGKNANFTITGNNNFAGVYAVRGGQTTTNGYATVTLTQNSKITGAVIADRVVMTGGAIVTSPTGSWSNSTDYLMTGSGSGTGVGAYGFSSTWKEVLAPGAGSIYTDGTNR